MSRNKKEPPDTTRNDSIATTTNISQYSDDVKNELRELRESHSLSAKEMVEEVRLLFPKYDKTLQSKCENGNIYGVKLKDKAWEALMKRFAPEEYEKAKKRRQDNHRLTKSVSCRLEDDEYFELKRLIKSEGFDTTQAWLAFRIRNYLKEQKNESN